MRTFVGVFLILLGHLSFAAAQPRKITLDQAIAAALENNPKIGLAAERNKQAQIREKEVRADLLPQVNAAAGYSHRTIDLRANGLIFPGLPGLAGPIGASEARLEYSASVFDLPTMRRYRSSKTITKATEFQSEAVKNEVASEVAELYSDALRSIAAVSAIEAQIELDQSLLDLATQRIQGGIGTKLETTTAESRLALDRQHLIEAENEVRSAKLHLLRAMGQRLDENIELEDSAGFPALDTSSVEKIVETALLQRPEWQAQLKRVEAAGQGRAAAMAEKLPTVQAFGSYGNLGIAGSFLSNYAAGIQLRLPVFDGGKRSAHHLTAASQMREEEIRARDLREQIELEVRLAMDRVRSAREQSRAADQNLRLSQEELDLAKLRFEAQVGIQIEVVEAQAKLAAARSRQVAAKFANSLATIELRHATGSLLSDAGR